MRVRTNAVTELPVHDDGLRAIRSSLMNQQQTELVVAHVHLPLKRAYRSRISVCSRDGIFLEGEHF